MNSADKLRPHVLLSLQRALLGAVSSNIRGVACAWDDSKIFIKSIYDGEVSEEDKEAMEVVWSEVLSDFPEHRVGVECVRLDYPEKLTCRVWMPGPIGEWKSVNLTGNQTSN